MSPHQLFERITNYLPTLIGALPIVLGIIVGVMLLNLIIGRMLLLLAARTNLTKTEVEPVRHIVGWILRVLGGVLILGVLGFELGGLWAMISTVLGLIAIGFVAVWSLLSNASSTVLILFLRPYQIGDDVEFVGEQVRGRVMDLNFFFTTLLDHEGNLIQIPNNLFFQKALKRRPNPQTVSLAHQLNNPTAALVERPPRPNPAAEAAPPPSEPDPLLSVPDPRSISPRPER